MREPEARSGKIWAWHAPGGRKGKQRSAVWVEVWNEDGNAGVGGSFVGMGGMGCYKHAGGAGIGDSLGGERRGGSMIELVLGRES
jgi:hypothetical protein